MVKRNRVVQAEQSLPIEEDCKSLIKKLASCKQTIRDRSLRTVLGTWLPEQTEISDEDMKKLWQGIFYCIWHADKSLYQSELIDRLSSALHSLPLPLSLHYFTVFLFTMRREWSRIDRLRLDKFYLLIRRFLNGFFSLLDSNSWDLELTRRLMSVLFDGTFLAGDKFQGNGVNYHIASAFVEELRPFLPLKREVLELLIAPFVKILGVVNDKILVGKIKSNLFDELLKMGKKLLLIKKSGSDEVPEDDDVVVLGSIALSMEFAKRFYEMGSSPDCHQGSRKAIFAIHKEFLQLEKDMSCSGIEVSITEVSRPGNDEVPELVPVSESESNAVSKSKKIVANGSSSKKKGLKKCSSKTKKCSAKEDAVMDDDVIDLGKKDEAFDETMISDLRQEFEKIASEMSPSKCEVASVCEVAEPVSITKKSKKRKRENKGEVQEDTTVVNRDAAETSLAGPSSEKSSKRVRFAMKNNLVWKPHCPLPPQDLRLPPSATPRGSALKKGIPAGPVRELASRRTKKKAKPAARRGVKTIKSLKKKMSP
ncbi:PREDICTED: ribosomal RNA processing protein 1 homolog [Camelina sativa]|uniref:Ribosomal RNA processing protein 1 homolog n=1 Tax=Camelina sativa TaxID=90675 RepID=A0ABM0T4U4_CAMSA|nr:PREDICTED: ribosomal RNA processing protein 1 homolog [Camelina sativa]